MTASFAFTPSRANPADLDQRTVGNRSTIETLEAAIRSAATSQNRPHTLLVGPRGAGKSHALEVALHRCRNVTGVTITRIPEDAVGISTPADVLFEVVRSLTPNRTVEEATLRARASADLSALEESIETLRGEACVVIVMENIDRVFEQLGESGQKALRGWIETSKNVLLICTAPLLFHAVQSRTASFYGSFNVVMLEPLTVEEGTALVTAMAQTHNDQALLSMLRSPAGHTRVQTLHHLAGGSPRLWTIFANCLSVDLLDPLVPAVEQLLEELVPYYQQRLWELNPSQQKLINALGQQTATATVQQLSLISGIEQRSAATELGRLEEAGWVLRHKFPGTDQRTTYYELREPLLRHHLQFRDNRRDELALIVRLLQSWFSRNERQQLLIHSPEQTAHRHYLAESLASDPTIGSDSFYANQSVPDLKERALIWMAGKDDDFGTVLAGHVLNLVIDPSAPDGEIPLAVRDKLRLATSSKPDEVDTIGHRLAIAADELDGVERALFQLAAACWGGERNPQQTLTRLMNTELPDDAPRLQLTIRQETAYWTGETGNPDEELRLYRELLPDQVDALGPTHPDTLTTRHNIAYLTGETGNPNEALRLLTELLPDRVDALGPTHPDTLTTRHNIAYWTGETGNPNEALRLLTELLPDRVDALGPTHPNTLGTRHNIAHWTGETGDPNQALRLLTELLPDRVDVRGPTHPATLTTRHNIAYWTRETGNPNEALRLLTELLPDRVDALGPTHPDTLTTRHNIAHWTGETGDPNQALRLLTELLPDRVDVRGPTHPATLSTRHNIAYWTRETGNPDEALRLFTELLPDQVDALGPTHPDTLTTRHAIAYLIGGTGNPDEALRLFTELLAESPELVAVTGTVLLNAAKIAIEAGLDNSYKVEPGLSPPDLLMAVINQQSAQAFAALPVELRTVLDPSE